MLYNLFIYMIYIMTYMKASKQVDKIVSNHTSFLKNKFYLEFTKINRSIFNIYWTIRFHKDPTKWRLIMASSTFPVKPLPNIVTAALKVIWKQMENYNLKP